jgi:hypothetical protein
LIVCPVPTSRTRAQSYASWQIRAYYQWCSGNEPVKRINDSAFLSCNLGTTTDALEEYASGDSGLQNLGDAYYQFNWKTPKTYANSCKTLKLN